MTGQLSLFGVEAGRPAVADLEGLLAGPGQVTRMGGTARVVVTVAERWRAQALLAEVRVRGLAASATLRADGSVEVRTAYAAALAPLATRWLRAGTKQPPSPVRLDGHRLRLWMIAAGVRDGASVLLGLAPGEEAVWVAARRALAGLGLSAELVVPGPAPHPAAAPDDPADKPATRDDRPASQDAVVPDDPAVRDDPAVPGPGGPGYRITDRRRLARLAELVGDAPAAAPAGAWPG